MAQYPYAAPTTIQGALFNEHDPRFKCCCGCCNVRTGSVVIAVLDALAMGTICYRSIQIYMRVIDDDAEVMPSLVYFFLSLFFTSTLLFAWCVVSVLGVLMGICCNNPSYLLPKIILQVLTAIFMLLLIVAFGLAATVYADDVIPQLRQILKGSHGSYKLDMESEINKLDSDFIANTEKNVMAVLLLGFAFFMGLYVLAQIWWLVVVHNCYSYLKEKRAWMAGQGGAGGHGAPSYPVQGGPQYQYSHIVAPQPHEYGFPPVPQGGYPAAPPPPAYTGLQMYGGHIPAHQPQGIYPSVDSMKI